MPENMEYVTLDDLEDRRLAKNDPAMFFQLHSLPVFIDEVQYAPELFSYIKIAIDMPFRVRFRVRFARNQCTKSLFSLPESEIESQENNSDSLWLILKLP